MEEKKNKVVVAVITNLTQDEAGKVTSDIIGAKSRHAPHSRGTVATGLKENVGKLLQGGIKNIEQRKEK